MDIKKNKRPLKKKMSEPDLSFLKEEQPVDVNEIEQPQHLTYKLGSALKQRAVMEAVVAVILFGAGLVIGAQFLAQETEPVKVVTAPAEPAAENQQVAGQADVIFPAGIYHKIELVSGDVYYSLISGSDGDFYALSNVFYTVEETGEAGGPPQITLALYEQAAEQPVGELLLAQEQVKAISQLSAGSSIVTAIEQYLAQLPAGEADGKPTAEAVGPAVEE